MVKVAPRTYDVVAGDFPIVVEIKAVHLAAVRAVASDLRLSVDGEPVGTTTPRVHEDQAHGVIRYAIEEPDQLPLDMMQTIDAFFDRKAPDNARYEITITAASGDSDKTSIRVPTINPGVANLAFFAR